jgi:hypothetical protein
MFQLKNSKKSFFEKALEERNMSRTTGHLSKAQKAKLIQKTQRKNEKRKRQKERMFDRSEKTTENTNESSLTEQRELLIQHTKDQDENVEKECAEREQANLRKFLLEFYKRSKSNTK